LAAEINKINKRRQLKQERQDKLVEQGDKTVD
jgi:hypothetical protein